MLRRVEAEQLAAIAWVLTKILFFVMVLVSYHIISSSVEFLSAYMANANSFNWPLVTQFATADTVVQQQRKRWPILHILRDQRQLGKYITLVRNVRNGDGTDF